MSSSVSLYQLTSGYYKLSGDKIQLCLKFHLDQLSCVSKHVKFNYFCFTTREDQLCCTKNSAEKAQQSFKILEALHKFGNQYFSLEIRFIDVVVGVENLVTRTY